MFTRSQQARRALALGNGLTLSRRSPPHRACFGASRKASADCMLSALGLHQSHLKQMKRRALFSIFDGHRSALLRDGLL
jgi:hypothetical protein